LLPVPFANRVRQPYPNRASQRLQNSLAFNGFGFLVGGRARLFGVPYRFIDLPLPFGLGKFLGATGHADLATPLGFGAIEQDTLTGFQLPRLFALMARILAPLGCPFRFAFHPALLHIAPRGLERITRHLVKRGQQVSNETFRCGHPKTADNTYQSAAMPHPRCAFCVRVQSVNRYWEVTRPQRQAKPPRTLGKRIAAGLVG
jgi:hypothetical protein